MAENSHISWTDHTFNPWIGCTRISPACDGCYAAHLMGGGRYNRVVWGEPGKGVGTRDRTKDWTKPRKWNRLATEAPGKTFVFCASLADVFDNAVDPEWRRDLFDLIRATPNLTYLLLTKRPSMIVKLFEASQALGRDADNEPTLEEAWPRNAAIGCTVANQEEADRDIPALLAAKAALNPAFAFLSMEPLLGPVDLTNVCPKDRYEVNALTGFDFDQGAACERIDWVITGGETDQGAHKARCGEADWHRSLRDQCAAAGVPFHFKQWGEWQPASQEPGGTAMVRRGKYVDPCTIDGVAHPARPIGFEPA